MNEEIEKRIKEKLGYMPQLDPVMVAFVLSVIEYDMDKFKKSLEDHLNPCTCEH